MDASLALFAIAVGFVSAGIIGNLWEIAAGEEPQFALLFDRDPSFVTPIRALAVVFSGPGILGSRALWWMIAHPFWGVPLACLTLLWSFVQGVFILTQVFGFS